MAAENLPVDPDVEPSTSERGPDVRSDVVAAVLLGGAVGGGARYAVGRAWPTAELAFPWPVLVVNLVGAFVLAVLVVAAARPAAPRYLRPLLGTGFCGALTTFSSVVVGLDELVAHARWTTAAAYLAATVVGGLATAALGLVVARALLPAVR